MISDLEPLKSAPFSSTAARPAWMVTFLDMLCSMLAMFILLFSMSKVHEDKWEEMLGGFTKGGKEKIKAVDFPSAAPTILNRQPVAALNLDYLSKLIRHQMDLDPFLQKSYLVRRADSLVISLPSDSLYQNARAELNQAFHASMSALAWAFSNIVNRIEVRGHTDPNPLHGGAYTSNWELSLARAQSIVNSLREGGYNRPIVARGLADSKFNDIAKDIPQAERYARARRIDIVIYPTGKLYW